MNKLHGSERMTFIILRGSLIVSIALTSLLLIQVLLIENLSFSRIIIALIIILYLLGGEYLIRKKHYLFVGWMIMVLYIFISTLTLLLWGLNAPMGILSIGFIIFLSGVMLGPKYIPWIIISVSLLLCIVQYIHTFGYIKPALQAIARPSDYFDVMAYITIFGIFSVLSWLSGKQTEQSLNRAQAAEDKLRAEKDNLVIRLEDQSRKLHQAKLEEMLRLYKFAEIGQTATATLHELANLLSVLTLDIDDIGHRHERSKAITNAKDGIDNINQLVRQTRQQLHDNRSSEVFSAIPIIERSVNEIQEKFRSRRVILSKKIPQRKLFKIRGDPLNLSHVMTILLNNALDACTAVNNGKVSVIISQNENLVIKIIDNGPGIPKNKLNNIFSPHKSTKPTGLGIGLYITKHIVESQLHGKIFIAPSNKGACFVIELPKYIKN